jgi:cytochrome bd-type quinol oxidase subunit 2
MVMSRYRWVHIAIIAVMIPYTGLAIYALFNPGFGKDVLRRAWWVFLFPVLMAALNYAFLAFRRSRDRKRMNP